MKKINLLVILTLIFCIASLVTGFADSDRKLPLLVDDAGLLTDSEESSLNSRLERISEEQECDVVIVTVYSLNGKTSTEYAEEFFEYYNYGYGDKDDGILLLVSMEYSDWWILTHGFAIKAFTDADLEYISDRFLPYLSDGEYKKAFSTFAELCEEELSQARAGTAFISGKRLMISLGIGILFALIITGIMKSKLKSVRYQPAASSYVRKDSLNMRVSRDLYLYSRLDRRAKPKDTGGSSTHRSSSGRTYGGRGGKF
jgi:uncharacterized protein